MSNDFTWNLHLIENNLRYDGVRSYFTSDKGQTESSDQVKTYKGYLNENSSNTVRLSFYNNSIEGFVKINDEVYRIIPVSRLSKTSNKQNVILICKEKEIINDLYLGNDMIKLIDSRPDVEFELKSINYGAPVRMVRIAVEGDYEFYQNHGSNSNSYIETVINMAEDVYQSTFNIIFRIVYINSYTSSNDPFTQAFTSSNKENFLYELNQHFISSHSDIYRDVTFLFTGKPTDNLAGIAFTPGSYGAVKDGATPHHTFAHELGHNFNADHNYAINCDTPNASIMCPEGEKKVPLYFTSANISRINSNISNRLITYSYFDDDVLCGSTSFSISNIPSGFTVSWPKSSNLEFSGNSTGSPVTIVAVSNGEGWVEPTLSRGSSSNTVKFPKDEFWVGMPDNTQIDMIVMFGQSPGNILCTNSEQTIAAGHTNAAQQDIESYYWDFGSWSQYHTGYDLWGITNSRPTFYLGGYPPTSQVIKAAAHNQCGHSMTYAKSKTFYAQNCYGLRLVFSPNPATGETTMTIETTSPEESVDQVVEWEMEVFNPSQSLKEKKTNLKGNIAKIQTFGWKEGVYLVRVKYKDEILTEKLVVKR
ncbi:hypothetical protein MASR2M47_07190 [Draconibacterium sp.]